MPPIRHAISALMPMTEADSATNARSPWQNSGKADREDADHPAHRHSAVDVEPALRAEHDALGHRAHLQAEIGDPVDEAG